MNFSGSFRDKIPADLVLHKPNLDGSISASFIQTIMSYKYLGVIFNPKLHWTLHQAKVLANTSFWSSQVWCLSCTTSGLPFNQIWQLYNTVVVPHIINKLASIQHKVAITITGAMHTMAGDIVDIHADILPVDLLFFEVPFRSTTHLLLLPCIPPSPDQTMQNIST